MRHSAALRKRPICWPSRERFSPGSRSDASQILLSYCGVRPLPRADGQEIGAVSRDHAIAHDTLPGRPNKVLSLIGGKWTTFRAFSAQAADAVLQLLGRPRLITTEDLPIGGGRGYPATQEEQRSWSLRLAAETGISPLRAQALLERYGTAAEKVMRFIGAEPETMLDTLPAYSNAEIAYLCQEEPVRRLADILFRRTAMAMEGLLSPAAINEVAAAAAASLGWSHERRLEETAHANSAFSRRLPQRMAQH